ncbi:ABC transporter ATP-binding protein [Aggregatilinea lenta]|uniref:ABC transporter ATP-binding protein n=1 Tax=Aggregatilinea lenta TaxID=913108 RepID=UPI000E5BA372|nr:ABC transporter ATP-binding protein [Aggregatilinea lenta]
MSGPFVTSRGLMKHYDTPTGSLEVLKGVDLEIQSGDFVAIIGPSGAGKTTLLNMITGVDTPSGGEIVVGDRRVTGTPPSQLVKWRARTIGVVFQFFQLLPTISVVDNVIFPMDYANVHQPAERRDYALSLLARLGIEDQAVKRPDMLSGGQQQRVAIARALANDPPLIIGDEPTANLDRMSTENVFNTFRDSAARGAAVIITTYDREIVASVPRVYELKDGLLHEVKADRRALV